LKHHIVIIMSSLRNAVKRVTHKERSQPRARNHLGLLEKKKDYQRRAKDFHFKTDLLTKMKERASMRNPDEFYFGMKNTQMKDGKHKKTLQASNKEKEALIGADAVRIMKDQDLSYIRMQKQKDAKKIERLQANLHHLESTKRKHVVFVESDDAATNFDTAEHFDTVPELAGRSFNRPRREALEKAALQPDANSTVKTEQALQRLAKEKRKAAKVLAKERAASYQEVAERARRISVLSRAEAHLVTEKLIAGKGRKRKIKAAEGGRPAQYKWRRQRAS
jgi:U3 small nucleolar RNA-associated protein 11